MNAHRCYGSSVHPKLGCIVPPVSESPVRSPHMAPFPGSAEFEFGRCSRFTSLTHERTTGHAELRFQGSASAGSQYVRWHESRGELIPTTLT